MFGQDLLSRTGNLAIHQLYQSRIGHTHLMCEPRHVAIVSDRLIQGLNEALVLLHGRDWRDSHDLVKFSYDFFEWVLPGQARSDFTDRRLVHLPLAQFIFQILEYGCFFYVFPASFAW